MEKQDIDETIRVGELNTLAVYRASEPGLYLISKDNEEVLLPNAYVKREMEIGSFLDVFVYTDSEDRLVSTTVVPYVYLYDIGTLEVVDMTKFGAFVDIGLTKDILVPKNKQKTTFNVGDKKVLQLQLDDRTDRLIASEKFDLLKDIKDLEVNDEVEIILYSKTPLGFKVVVNSSYEGMIYHNEIFENIYIGDKKKAYVKNIRDDNKLDISLQKIGKKVDDNKIMEVLETYNGRVDFTYKSDAEDIKNMFGMSKKAFKATLTKLINENKVVLDENSIRVKS